MAESPNDAWRAEREEYGSRTRRIIKTEENIVTTTTPRTRRQLREALKTAQNHRDTWKATAAADREKIKSFHAKAKADGWTPIHSTGIYLFEQPPIVDYTVPDRAAADALHAEELSAAKINAEIRARRETLEKVIDALEIKCYSNGGTIHATGGYTAHQDTERFWSDIQTALEVRAEKKREDERQATANKVAGLAKPKTTLAEQLGIHIGGTIDASKLQAGHHSLGKIKAEDLAPAAVELSGESLAQLADAMGSSYGTAAKVPESKPKKKPAAKKGSKK